MDVIVSICIALIGYLLYRVNGQKKQLSYLHSHLEKLQQHLVLIQLQISKKDDVEDHVHPQQVQAKTEIRKDNHLSDPWLSANHEKPSQQDLDPSKTESAQNKVTNPEANPSDINKEMENISFSEQAFSSIKAKIINYFTQGNQIVRIGIVVLFFGLSFLAKYSIENSLVPIEVRMTGILMAAIFMLIIGWRLRLKNPAYGLIMQGGGIAVSYLAIFASFKLYLLIPAELAFPILILISIMAMSLAIIQDSKALAVTAITGGFASPIFTATGTGSHVGLFSYYLVLNCAIFCVAWFKSWRSLNVIGFIFTFFIASIWGISQYRSASFSSTEPFLIGYFLIYVAISILFSIKQKPNLKGYVDGTLVFGLPVVCFGLQTGLVHHMEYGLAFSSAALSAFYLCITIVLYKSKHKNLVLLTQAMGALSVTFGTLTIAFALDGKWTAASWALEGAGFVWIAYKQKRELIKYAGLGIQLLGGLIFLAEPYAGEGMAFLNTEFMSVSLLVLAALFSAYLLQLKKDSDQSNTTNESLIPSTDLKQNLFSVKSIIDATAGVAFIAWGFIWWYAGGLTQIDEHISSPYKLTLYVAFLAASSLLWLLISQRWNWQRINFFPWLLLLPLCLYFWPTVIDGSFLSNFGYLSWSIALSSLYLIFHKTSSKRYPLYKPTALHSISYLLTLCIIGYEIVWRLEDINLSTAWSALGIMIALISALIFASQDKKWPMSDSPYAYHIISSTFIMIAMSIWTLAFNFTSVLKASPLIYIPLINPIDLIQIAGLWAVISWYKQHANKVNWLESMDQHWILGSLAVFIFTWFNVLLLKTVHVITLVPYTAQTLFNSAVVQTSVSIVWTLIGLLIMVFASKKMLRSLWLIGAGLIAIVVAKLFILDLDGQGTIERIISFLVVGGLLLVIGYFSPVPPSSERITNNE